MWRDLDAGGAGSSMNRRLATLALFFLLFLTLAGRAAAEGDPPEETGWIGMVTGQVTNGTAGGLTPGGLSLMLHAWEGDSEMVMLDGALDDSGAFGFETVPMDAGWTFAAMLSYNEVTFFSETVEVQSGMDKVTLPLTVYETTT